LRDLLLDGRYKLSVGYPAQELPIPYELHFEFNALIF